jgi:hypothetical protein
MVKPQCDGGSLVQAVLRAAPPPGGTRCLLDAAPAYVSVFTVKAKHGTGADSGMSNELVALAARAQKIENDLSAVLADPEMSASDRLDIINEILHAELEDISDSEPTVQFCSMCGQQLATSECARCDLPHLTHRERRSRSRRLNADPEIDRLTSWRRVRGRHARATAVVVLANA